MRNIRFAIKDEVENLQSAAVEVNIAVPMLNLCNQCLTECS